MRRGIAGVLKDEPDIAIVAEADDGVSARERYFELLPDVTLMERDGQGIPEQCAVKAAGQRPHLCGGDRAAARDAGLK
jgi:DNA-binding NarL/FixJ family response regulator